jgi:cytoskeletal protein CcmA (bactofilin family)
MFKEKEGRDEIETVIGPSVQVEGDFVAAGDVVIEGMVSGNVRTDRNLRIGEGARLFANVAAANAVISGEVQGNIKIEGSLELLGTARIFGDIKTKTISIATGATLQGKCSAGDERKSKPEKVGADASRKIKNKNGVKTDDFIEETEQPA